MFIDIPDQNFVQQIFNATPAQMTQLTQKAKNSWMGKLCFWEFVPGAVHQPSLTPIGQTVHALTSVPSLAACAALGIATSLYTHSYWPAAATVLVACAGRKFNIKMQCCDYLAGHSLWEQRQAVLKKMTCQTLY